MKKSKVFLALTAAVLMILCCSAAGCTTVSDTDKINADTITSVQSDSAELSETDEKRIYSGTRQDRIEVYYINKSGEHIPWDVIHDFNDYSIDYEEDVLLQIPEEMTLVEAIEYCNNCSNVYLTDPGSTYMRSVVYGDSRDISDIDTNVIHVIYNDNSSFRLPWTEIYNLSNRYEYCIPEEMTLADAFAYCNTIDDIVCVYFDYIYQPADGSIVNSPAIPCPVLGIIIGLLCAGLILLRRRN